MGSWHYKAYRPAVRLIMLLTVGLIVAGIGCSEESEYEYFPIEDKVLIRLAEDPQAGAQSDVFLLAARTRMEYGGSGHFLSVRSRTLGTTIEVEFMSVGWKPGFYEGVSYPAEANVRLGPLQEGDYNLIITLRDSIFTGPLIVLSDQWQVTWSDSSAVVFENTSLTRINP
jgi:hypothetical protein